MTDKNDALFLVRPPFGQKTIPYEEVPELIAMAKSPGYDGEHEAVMLALDVCHEEGLLRAAVQAGEVEVLDKSLHRMTQPFNGRLKDTVLTVQALREYVESIKGFLEVEDSPAANVEAVLAPMQRQQFQELEILRVIRELKYEPTKLPKVKQGNPGVKAEVRAKLDLQVGIFDKAWERLRKQGEIKDAK